jgi:hypothetical protein
MAVNNNTLSDNIELNEIPLIPKDSRDTTKTYLSMLHNDDKTKRAKEFQICGGFEIPDGVDLESLKTDNILQKLCQIARQNVVAVSEMGDGKDYTTDYKKVNFKKEKEGKVYIDFNLGKHIPCLDDTKGIDDTCFVIHDMNKFKCEDNNPSIIFTKNMISNNCGILSIHFASNGPNLLTKETKERAGKQPITNEKAISEFVKEQLVADNKYKLNENNKKRVRVVCGDTNITISKCSKVQFTNIKDFDNTLDVDEKKLDTIGQLIAQGFNDYFGGYWVVIMSNYKIDKIRKGFLLINQQINKSDIKTNPEPDGTIIAIKLSDDKNYNFTGKSEAITELTQYCNDTGYNSELPRNYRWHTSGMSSPDKNVKISANSLGRDYNDGKIMTFPLEDYYNQKFKKGYTADPKNRKILKYPKPVFLDHSVVQIPSYLLNKLLKIDNTPMFRSGNPFADDFMLFSLNMGSIVNSGRKNWNTRYIEQYDKIKNADKQLYELVQKNNTDVLPYAYDKFVGKDLIGKNIKYDPKFTEEKRIIGSVEEKKTSGGYKNKTKKNKNRNRNRKSKSKNKTKKNKNKNRKSKSKNTTKKNKNTKKHKNNKKK